MDCDYDFDHPVSFPEVKSVKGCDFCENSLYLCLSLTTIG